MSFFGLGGIGKTLTELSHGGLGWGSIKSDGILRALRGTQADDKVKAKGSSQMWARGDCSVFVQISALGYTYDWGWCKVILHVKDSEFICELEEQELSLLWDFPPAPPPK